MLADGIVCAAYNDAAALNIMGFMDGCRASEPKQWIPLQWFKSETDYREEAESLERFFRGDFHRAALEHGGIKIDPMEAAERAVRRLMRG